MRISDWSSDVCSSDLVTRMPRSGQRRSADDNEGSQMLLRTRIARATAIGALVLAAPALSSCSFATDKVYTPGPGATDRSERVDVINPEDGRESCRGWAVLYV